LLVVRTLLGLDVRDGEVVSDPVIPEEIPPITLHGFAATR
jgi:hypothetical protein